MTCRPPHPLRRLQPPLCEPARLQQGCHRCKRVDRDHDRYAETQGILDVVLHVARPAPQQVQVFIRIRGCQRLAGYHLGSAAVHLECAHGSNQHHHMWDQTRVAAFDIEEFFHADIRAKARFGDHVIGQLESDPVSDDRAVARGRYWQTVRHGRRPACLRGSASRLGLMASFIKTVIAPATPRSSAVTASPLRC